MNRADQLTNDFFGRYGLRRVINVSGTETPYGSSPVIEEVIQAAAQLAPHSVMMHELQRAANEAVQRATGAEAGCVTGCTAASIAIAVAATMTGTNIGLVEQLPDTNGMKSEVVLQRGHHVSYGQQVSQNIRLVGARLLEIGAVHQTGLYQLRQSLSASTTAALFVVSHLTAQHGMIRLKDFIEICHEAKVPVIVDAASTADPIPYIRAGADLVLWSAHKAFSSFTAGYIAGRHDLVRACMCQEHGIGRPMKVGKEGVIGAIAALETWIARDVEGERRRTDRRVKRVAERLSALPGVTAATSGRQVYMTIDAIKSGVSAVAVAACLAAGDPAILVWHHHASSGKLVITLNKVSDETADFVCAEMENALAGKARTYEGSYIGIADEMIRPALDGIQY